MTGTCSMCGASGVQVEVDHPVLRRNAPNLTRTICIPCHRAWTATQHDLAVVGSGIAPKAQPPANAIEAAASILIQCGALLRQIGDLDLAMGEQLRDAWGVIEANAQPELLTLLDPWQPPDTEARS
ncbi:MAG: hypothetical protein ACYDAG_14055 [Chloroflexota bacterium]